MKHYYLIVMAMLFVASIANAQLTGTKNIPGDYADLATAIADLNAVGVGAGGVTLNLVAGNPQTAPNGGYTITATGTMADPIIFNGNGNTITANGALTAGVLHDAIFELIGSDYVTIQGFVMQENPANTTTAAGTNNMTEWGVALLYATTTNGAQNCTIQNNTISLNRTYQNTFGIYSNSTHTASAVSVSASATTAAGGNSGLKIYGNNISNVNQGIVVVGPTAAADMNTGIDIGGTGGSQTNTINNFGTTGTFSTYANVSGTVYGILVRNSIGYNVSFNSITSSVGGVTSGTLRGIYNVTASNPPTGTYTNNINNNNIALTYGASSGTMQGIAVEASNATTTSTGNINNNNFSVLTASITSSVTITAISTVAPHLTLNVNGNTFTNITTNTTGSFTFIGHSYTMPASGSQTLNNNSIVTAFNKTGAGGTVTIMTTGSSSPNSASASYTNNNFSNITVTGTTGITGFNNSDGSGTSPTKSITNNTFNNWTGGTSGIVGITFSYVGGTTSFSNNVITNITGQSSITAINIASTVNLANPLTVSSNTISNLTSTGTGGAVTAVSCSNTSAIVNINNNSISTLSSTGTSAVSGISITGATTTNVFKNTICDITGSNASSTVNGILVSAGTTVNVRNNRISNLSTPNANAANPLNGINITGGTTVNAYYNSVYINASSTGALFGSSALSASTTSNLTLNNNILANISSQNGAGLSVAYRRSTTTLTTYSSTSNNNDFFATTVYTDGTTPQASLAAYKALVTPRDANSISVNPPFLSTSCGANNLKIDPTIATQIESGGANISGITDDFENEIRQGNSGYSGTGTAPDIGADEFEGTPAMVCSGTPASSTITGTTSVCTGSGTTLALSNPYADLGLTFQWQSSPTSGSGYSNLGTGITQATGSLTATTYFICTITCTNSGLSYTTPEFAVNINSLPPVMVTPSSASVCQPGGSAVSLSASGASTYTWSPATGLSATTGANVDANPSATTTYTVTGTDGNGCTNTAQSMISINPKVNLNNILASSSEVCNGGGTTLTAVGGTSQDYIMSATSINIITPVSPVNTSIGDDALLNTITMPFSFSFFGNVYNTLFIYSNGYVAFQSGVTGSPYNQIIPSSVAPDNFIAISHDDLNVTLSGQMSYFTSGTTPNRIFVVNYNGVKYYNSAANNGDLTGQIQLFEADNHIEIHVQNSVDPVLSAKSLGIENVGGTLGYSPAARNNVSYDISSPEAWKFVPSGGTLTYLWSESPANATLSSTSTNPTSASNITVDEIYSVTVTANGCSATLQDTITVSAGAAITSQPSPTAKCAGQNASFSVAATGPTLSYQWKKGGSNLTNGGNISGATSATLNIASVSASDADTYTVEVSSSCGSPVLSNGASVLTVNALPTATLSPSGMNSICEPLTHTITASSDIGDTYVWKKNGSLISGATNSSYGATASGIYKAVISVAATGCADSTLVLDTLTVNSAPSGVNASASMNSICSGSSIDLFGSGTFNSIVISEDFQIVPPGWTVATGNGGNNWFQTNSPSGSAHSGTGVAQYTYNSTLSADAYLFSPGQTLVGGITYNVSSWYRNSGTTFPEKLRVTVGNAANIAAQTTVIQDLGTITNSVYLQQSATFTPISSGTYFFAWHAYSLPDEFYINLDDILITGDIPLTYAWTSNPSGFTSPMQNPMGVNPSETTSYNLVVTAGNGCTNSADVTVTVEGTVVKSQANAGAGSLRNVYGCTPEDGTITYDLTMADTSFMTAPLIIDKNVTIQGNGSVLIDFQGSMAQGLQINTLKALTLDGMNVNGGAGVGSVIANDGTLNLKASTINGDNDPVVKNNPLMPESKIEVIENSGTSSIKKN